MGIARDIFEILDQNVNDFEETISDKFKGSDPNSSSLSRKAAEGTLQFPLLVSRNINYETASRIAKATEVNAASFTQIVLTMNPEMDISNDKGAAEYVKKFHTNIDTTDDVFSDAMRFANNEKSTESYYLTKFCFVDDKSFKVMKEELKEYGIDWREETINDIVKEKLTKDNMFKDIISKEELMHLLDEKMRVVKEVKEIPKGAPFQNRIKRSIDFYNDYDIQSDDDARYSIGIGKSEKGEPQQVFLVRNDDDDLIVDARGRAVGTRTYSGSELHYAMSDYITGDNMDKYDPELVKFVQDVATGAAATQHIYDKDLNRYGYSFRQRPIKEEPPDSNFDPKEVNPEDYFKEDDKNKMILVDKDGKEINSANAKWIDGDFDVKNLLEEIPKGGRILLSNSDGEKFTIDKKGWMYDSEGNNVGKWQSILRKKEKMENELNNRSSIRLNNRIREYDEDEEKKKKNNIYSAISGPDVVGRNLLTKANMDKLNDLQPILLKVTVIAMDRSAKGDGIGRTFSFVIGVKATVHGIQSEEMVEQLVDACRYHDEIFRFIRWTTGEINFFTDFLLNLKDSKKAISKQQSGGSPWWNRLHRMRTIANFKKRMFMKNRVLPNTSVAVTIEEVEYIKNNFGFDLMNPKFAEDVMNKYFLLCFIVVDESLEAVHFKYDGQKSYQTISFTGLDRQNSDKAKDFRDILKVVQKV